MPIDRELLRGRAEAAEAFLDSRDGAILHEVGHYVAANIGGPISGHLIVSARVERVAGAFVPDDPSARDIASDPARWSLMSSAGVLSEYHFCGSARLRRARGDVEAYQSMFGLSSVDLIVARWKHEHLKDIVAHTACINENFDRCVLYCRDGKFLLGEHHVIPSCMLWPPYRRDHYARLRELTVTYPIKQRRRALEEFLAAHSALLGSQFP
jgi:hypothetical protein